VHVQVDVEFGILDGHEMMQSERTRGAPVRVEARAMACLFR
jgi:hypothetical protein